MLFLTLAMCNVFNNMVKKEPYSKKRVYLFTGVSVALFAVLLPVSSGIWAPGWYFDWFAKWLPTWQFQ
jgi:hypothetical protein